MGISPINPIGSQYSASNQQQSDWNQIQFGLTSLLAYYAMVAQYISPSGQSQFVNEEMKLEDEVKNQTITPSQATAQLNQLIDQLNKEIPSQYAYPNDFAVGNVTQQINALLAFISLALPSPQSGQFEKQVQSILTQLQNGTLSPKQAMADLLPIVQQIDTIGNNTFPYPNPANYPT